MAMNDDDYYCYYYYYLIDISNKCYDWDVTDGLMFCVFCVINKYNKEKRSDVIKIGERSDSNFEIADYYRLRIFYE